jgi:hypothetical protein
MSSLTYKDRLAAQKLLASIKKRASSAEFYLLAVYPEFTAVNVNRTAKTKQILNDLRVKISQLMHTINQAEKLSKADKNFVPASNLKKDDEFKLSFQHKKHYTVETIEETKYGQIVIMTWDRKKFEFDKDQRVFRIKEAKVMPRWEVKDE